MRNTLTFKMTILGPPRTKKTSNRIVTRKSDGRQFVLPSAANESWTKNAVRQLLAHGKPKLAEPVNLCALIYRDALRGDTIGYLQAICDALERAGVVVNDKWIVSFDGSRPLKDKNNPRVEIELTPLQ